MRKLFTPFKIAWFVLIVICALTIISFCASAHCYPTYMWSGPVTSVGPSTVSTSYSGDKNFHSAGSSTVVFSTAVNFTGWRKMNFELKTYVKAPINFPSGRGEIGFYGDNKADYVSMNDSDIIYAEGGMEIVTLISNNSKPGQYNMIFTPDSVKIGGKYYKPKDTFYSTPGNPETAVLITDCKGVSLPIKLLQFSAQVVKDTMIDVSWVLADKDVSAELQYSSDGRLWETIYQGSHPFFTITNTHYYNFIRLKADDDYSNTIMRVIEKKPVTHGIYDILGRKLNYIPDIPGTYIIR